MRRGAGTAIVGSVIVIGKATNAASDSCNSGAAAGGRNGARAAFDQCKTRNARAATPATAASGTLSRFSSVVEATSADTPADGLSSSLGMYADIALAVAANA